MSTKISAGRTCSTYELSKSARNAFGVQVMRRLLDRRPGDKSGNGSALTDESGYPNVGSDTGLFSVAAKTALLQGAWTHLAAVVDETDISLFVNGLPVVLHQGGRTGTPWSPTPRNLQFQQLRG